MNAWQVLFWGTVAGIILILLLAFSTTIICRIFWAERRIYLLDMARALQPIVRDTKEALVVKKGGPV